MPRIPGAITKGSIFRKLDEFLSKPQQHFLDDLRNPANAQLDQLGESRGLLEGQKQRDHASREFFGDEGEQAAWWPGNEKKQEITRQGYIKATELALEHDPPKPIVTYWVRGGESFQVAVAESDQEVTILLLTPPGPEVAKANTLPHVDERLWLIARDEDLAAVQEEYLPEERPKAVATDTEGVSWMQLRAPA